MQMRNLGRSGLRVSVVGLGCNNFGRRLDLEGARPVVHAALDAGVTLFDTADMYGERGGSETILGQLLGPRRKDIVLATKFGWQMDDSGQSQGASRRYIHAAVDASLKRLQTDWIDLYQLHKPDSLTPMEETLGALDDLVRAGKVRYIGCSNLPAWQVVDALWLSRSRNIAQFISAQDELSLVVRKAEAELIPALAANGLGLLPYFPLAGGLLTGKYAHGGRPANARLSGNDRQRTRMLSSRNVAIADKLDAFARSRGRTLLQVAFAWLLAKPIVASVIAGASKPDQVAANVAAGAASLSGDELAQIEALATA
jgi:aryl-alcohol dehydrogenase-like predicted oxidoreductase